MMILVRDDDDDDDDARCDLKASRDRSNDRPVRLTVNRSPRVPRVQDGDVTYLHTMVRSADLEKTMHFFQAVGLRETRRKESENGRFTLVFMASAPGAPEVEITYNWDPETFAPPSRSMGHLAYAVDDIYAKAEALQEAGIEILRPPRDGKMMFVKSPDGISVEILQKGTPLEPKEPWASMQNVGTW